MTGGKSETRAAPRKHAVTTHVVSRMDEIASLRDRARQCRVMAKNANDEPMRLMLEQIANDLDLQADSAQTAAKNRRE